jgi:hypothetical protein
LRLRWTRGTVLAFRTQSSRVQSRSKPSDFSGRKKKSSARVPFGREVKLWVPYRRLTACKRSLNATWKSGIFRLNLPAITRPHSSTFWLLGSFEDHHWRKFGNIYITGLQLQLSLLRVRGSAELVEKSWKVQYGG